MASFNSYHSKDTSSTASSSSNSSVVVNQKMTMYYDPSSASVSYQYHPYQYQYQQPSTTSEVLQPSSSSLDHDFVDACAAASAGDCDEKEETSMKPFIIFSIMTIITIFTVLLSGYILKVSVLHRVLSHRHSQEELLNVFQYNSTMTMLLPISSGDEKNFVFSDRRMDLYVTRSPSKLQTLNAYAMDHVPTNVQYVSWNRTVDSAVINELVHGSQKMIVLLEKPFATRNGTKLTVNYNVRYLKEDEEEEQQVRFVVTRLMYDDEEDDDDDDDDDNNTADRKERRKLDNPSAAVQRIVMFSEVMKPQQSGGDSSFQFELSWPGNPYHKIYTLDQTRFEFSIEYDDQVPNGSKLAELSVDLHFQIPTFAIPPSPSHDDASTSAPKYEQVTPQTRIQNCKFLLLEYAFVDVDGQEQQQQGTENPGIQHYHQSVPTLNGKVRYMKMAAQTTLGITIAVCLVCVVLLLDILVMIGYCLCFGISSVSGSENEGWLSNVSISNSSDEINVASVSVSVDERAPLLARAHPIPEPTTKGTTATTNVASSADSASSSSSSSSSLSSDFSSDTVAIPRKKSVKFANDVDLCEMRYKASPKKKKKNKVKVIAEYYTCPLNESAGNDRSTTDHNV